VRCDKSGQALAKAVEQPLRVAVYVTDALARDYPAAQVKQGQSGVLGRPAIQTPAKFSPKIMKNLFSS